jgi:hypothetical protein
VAELQAQSSPLTSYSAQSIPTNFFDFAIARHIILANASNLGVAAEKAQFSVGKKSDIIYKMLWLNNITQTANQKKLLSTAVDFPNFEIKRTCKVQGQTVFALAVNGQTNNKQHRRNR